MAPQGVKAAPWEARRDGDVGRALRPVMERGSKPYVKTLVIEFRAWGASKLDTSALRRQFRYRTLAAFRLTVETHSATRAAEELGITQPAVSQLLAGLERSVGFPLFHRGPGRRLELTLEARELYRAVCGALDAIGQLEALVQVLADADRSVARRERWAPHALE